MPNARLRRRRPDAARRVALGVLTAVSQQDAYANLELSRALAEAELTPRDAAFATELVAGTSRLRGTYDAIISSASGRAVEALDPSLRDVLRLGVHQLVSMRVPTHAAVAATVDLAAAEVGERVAGLTNAVLRKVAARDLAGWVEVLVADAATPADALALRTHHPRWIVDAVTDVLGDEAEAALAANNVTPLTNLVIRPGLSVVADLDGSPNRLSPFGAARAGRPGEVAAVREGRAGVQDEGSQLVAWALARTPAPSGPWLDLCAGPGGKAALLAGLARAEGERLLAAELQPHRATLVAQALRAYGSDADAPLVVAADGTRPAWPAGAFARVMADVPCSGLGALRRRPESRWRRTAADVAGLAALQRQLLASALDACAPGGVVAYVTCSPHREETQAVVADVVGPRADVEILDAPASLPELTDAARGRFVQLWPHRHGTDAMFLALLRVRRR